MASPRLDALPFDGTRVQTLARLALLASALGEREVAGVLHAELAPYADDDVVIGAGVAWLGPVARYLGVLALTMGRVDEAVARLEDALARSRRSAAPAQVAHVQAVLAQALRARGDASAAQRLEGESAAAAQALGLEALRRELAQRGAVSGDVAVASAAAPSASPQVAPVARLAHDDGAWLVAHGDETTRLRDMKGVRYLALLLREPGRELHALDVVGDDVEPDPDAGELATPAARRAYRARLLELRADLEEAREHNDLGAAAVIEEKIAALTEQLARVVGVDGPRRPGSMAERARINATRAIRKAIDRISADCPRLGRHLSNSVETGRICCYRPDPTFPVEWEVAPLPSA
ncbi:MAG TPA: tetratricopeptide repeat protein [Candidatus Binatia bacterium]